MLAETAVLITLHFTLPRTLQNAWTSNDTTYIECGGGAPMSSLRTARLYVQPVTGGPYRLVQEHNVTGRAGQPDSFVVDPGAGAHYYVTATNTAGESCASNAIYVPGTVVTGVPTQPAPRDGPVVSSKLFDVHGRLVRNPTRSGVYWRREEFASGRVRSTRLVIVK